MNTFILDFLSFGAVLSGILVITRKNPVISVLFLISLFVNVAGYLVLLGVGFIGISYLIVYVGAIAILFLFVVMILNLQLQELSAAGSEYTQNMPLGAIIGSLFLIELNSILPFYTTNNFIRRISGSSAQKIPGAEESHSIIPEMSLGILNWFNSFFINRPKATTNNSTISLSNAFINESMNNAPSDKYRDIHVTFNPISSDTHFADFLQIQSIGQNLYTYGAIWLLITSFILLLRMVGPITLSMNKSNNLFYPPFPNAIKFYCIRKASLLNLQR